MGPGTKEEKGFTAEAGGRCVTLRRWSSASGREMGVGRWGRFSGCVGDKRVNISNSGRGRHQRRFIATLLMRDCEEDTWMTIYVV